MTAALVNGAMTAAVAATIVATALGMVAGVALICARAMRLNVPEFPESWRAAALAAWRRAMPSRQSAAVADEPAE